MTTLCATLSIPFSKRRGTWKVDSFCNFPDVPPLNWTSPPTKCLIGTAPAPRFLDSDFAPSSVLETLHHHPAPRTSGNIPGLPLLSHRTSVRGPCWFFLTISSSFVLQDCAPGFHTFGAIQLRHPGVPALGCDNGLPPFLPPESTQPRRSAPRHETRTRRPQCPPCHVQHHDPCSLSTL